MTDERRHELRWLAIALLAVLAGFFDLVFLGRAFVGFDHAIEYLPTWSFQRESILRFELPLWDPRAGCGTPLLAAMFGGALDPVRWAFYPLPCVTGYTLHIVFLHLLAAAGAFRLSRALGARPAVACFVAILLGAGGPLRSLGGFEKELACTAWIPWFLLTTVSFARSPSLERALVAGVLMGLIVLAGGPEYALAAGVLLVAAAHWRMAIEIRSGERGKLVLLRLHALCAVAGLLSALLSLGVLLPALELSRISTRRAGVPLEEALAHATSTCDLATLVFPGLLGNTAHESWTLGKALVGPSYSYFLPVLYPSVLAVLLVPLAPFRKSRAARGLLAVLLLAIVFSLGRSGFLATLCFEACPPLRVFRYPYKAWAFAAPALAVLAGMGLERFLGEGAGNGARVALYVTAGLGLAASAIGGWLSVFPESLANVQRGLLDNPTQRVADTNHVILAHAARVLVTRGLLLAAFALALEQLRDLQREKRLALIFLLCASASLDLTLVGRAATPTVSKDFYETPPFLAQFMSAKDGEPPPRFYPSPLSSPIPPECLFDLHDYWSEHAKDRLRENLGTLFGLYQLHSYNPGFLDCTNELYYFIESCGRDRRPMILADTATEFVVSDRHLEHPALALVAESPGPNVHRIYALGGTSPRYTVEPSAQSDLLLMYVLDRGRTWENLLSEDVRRQLRPAPPFDAIGLRDGQSIVPALESSKPRALVASFASRRVELELPTDVADGSFLIARDAYEPRWRAFVDGEPTEVRQTDIAFRAIPLKKGARRVVMEYDATLARASFAVQASCWAAVAVAFFLLTRRRRTS
ncbi:hypothetical protein HY251_02210 [bacterium]|nr:hypothetical protein [bacterium]